MAKDPNVSFPVLETPQSLPYESDTRILPRNVFASGTLPGNTVIRVGEDNLKIDGENRRITLNDGTNDRILIGFESGGF